MLWWSKQFRNPSFVYMVDLFRTRNRFSVETVRPTTFYLRIAGADRRFPKLQLQLQFNTNYTSFSVSHLIYFSLEKRKGETRLVLTFYSVSRSFSPLISSLDSIFYFFSIPAFTNYLFSKVWATERTQGFHVYWKVCASGKISAMCETTFKHGTKSCCTTLLLNNLTIFWIA